MHPLLRMRWRAQIDLYVNGMFATRRVPDMQGIRVKGTVTDKEIIVTFPDGKVEVYEGGRYASRKVNLCYSPLMPRRKK